MMRSEHIQESYENDKKMASSKKKTKKKMNNGLHLWTENRIEYEGENTISDSASSKNE